MTAVVFAKVQINNSVMEAANVDINNALMQPILSEINPMAIRPTAEDPFISPTMSAALEALSPC
jgi:hypothetical protein